MTNRQQSIAFLGSIVALHLLLRGYHLTQPLVDAFSWREASTAMIADNLPQNGWNLFLPEVNWTGPGPSYQGREFQLFTLVVALLQEGFGWHDWYGRLVSIIMSLGTLIALHRLTARVWDETHAHATALVYALLPGAIMIDSSALPDATMLALTVTGVWLFVLYIDTGRRQLLILAAASFALGALTKLPGFSVALVIAYLITVMALRSGVRTISPSLLAALAVICVVFAYYAWAVHVGNSYPPYHVAGSGYIWDVGIGGFWKSTFYLEELKDIAILWYYGYPLVVLFLVGLWFMPLRGADNPVSWIPHVWLISVALLYLVAARELTDNPWNLHVFHPAFAWFGARGALVLTTIGARRTSWMVAARAGALAIIVVSFSTIPLTRSMKQPVAENSRQLGLAIAEHARPSDLVITVAATVGDPIAIYYSRLRGWVFPPGGGQRAWSLFVDDDDAAIEEFQTLRAQGADWFGYVKNARDAKKRLFTEHHAGFLHYLETRATLVDDDSRFALYRLARR